MNKKLKLWVGVGSFILVETSLGVTSSMAENKLTQPFLESKYSNLIAGEQGEDGENDHQMMNDSGESGEDGEMDQMMNDSGESGENGEMDQMMNDSGEDGEDGES